ncbi:YncE family protein [Tepidibacter aestuarii]|uniref:YncE family protein n=1 Tax=Tepidibacter aestuarii TaxID=2925782 RepID=UPI0020C12C40|nr:YncE family protein [Tepidibacter aestuarii]CAH2214464.1 DNA-binding beta-propeller fold protein YncE [Tepidibacter aestuarii]
MKIYVSNFCSNNISVINEKLEVEDTIYLDENMYVHHFCIDDKDEKIYIPSGLEGMLYVVSIKDKATIESISIGGNLSQVAMYSNEELYIANEDSNSIYIIDVKNNDPVGLICVDNMPHGIIIDEEQKKLYVPCLNSLLIIDIINKSIVKNIKLTSAPWHLKINREENIIYIVAKNGSIILVDRFKFEILNVLRCFKFPVEISINYLKKEMYVTDFCNKSLEVLNYKTNELIKSIAIEGRPLGIGISKDESKLFVTDVKNNLIKVFETSSLELIKNINVDKEPTTIICR